jgi:transposase-like protein
MVRKRYLDKEEIIELRKENEELKRQLAILPKKAMENLSSRE